MSRHRPEGFILGVIIEVAAVVFVIALLPRIDWGLTVSTPKSASAATFIPPADAASRLPLPDRALDWVSISHRGQQSSPRETMHRAASVKSDSPPATSLHAPPLLPSTPPDQAYAEKSPARPNEELSSSVAYSSARPVEEASQLHQTAPTPSLSPTQRDTFVTRPRPWLTY